jgi:hypothetical protein
MRRDYELLYWNLRQLEQWRSQKGENGQRPTVEEARKAFRGTILVGDEKRVPYVTDRELESQIAHPRSPSNLSEEIVARRWGFTESSGKTYIRRKSHSKPTNG